MVGQIGKNIERALRKIQDVRRTPKNSGRLVDSEDYRKVGKLRGIYGGWRTPRNARGLVDSEDCRKVGKLGGI